MQNEFFTSDPHWFHTNIIRHCNRPFSSMEEMNEVMIERWNSKIKPKDNVKVLGDMFFGHIGSRLQVESVLSRLNGNITLIRGNHDGQWLKLFPEKPFPVHQYLMTKVKDQYIFLCHYTMVNWDRSHYGTWHLYGHSHEDKVAYKPPNSLNVAVDLHDFYPLEFEEVRDKILKSVDVKTVVL